MNEILIREALVFCGAVAGAVWGYHLGKIIERRRVTAEISASLEAIERWTVDVCRGLEDLERSLGRMGHFALSEVPADLVIDARATQLDTRRVSPLGPGDEIALRRFLSRVTNRT